MVEEKQNHPKNPFSVGMQNLSNFMILESKLNK
jgi:hypothetical protein